MKSTFSKIVSVILIGVFVLPLPLLAQETEAPPVRAQRINTAQYFGNGQQSIVADAGINTGAGQGVLSCSAASILATLLQGTIGNVVGGLTGSIFGNALSPEVPVSDNTQRAKDTGATIFGIPILPSWDSVANCLSNLVVGYLSQTALQFIQQGYNGNPIYLPSPELFARQILDNELRLAMFQVANSNLPPDYIRPVQRNLLAQNLYGPGHYSGYNYQGYNNTSLGQFLSGQTGPQGFLRNFAQISNNNIYTAQYQAQKAYEQRYLANLSAREAELAWGSGILPQRGADGNVTKPGYFVGIESAKVSLGLFDKFLNEQGVNSVARHALGNALGNGIGSFIFGNNRRNNSGSVQIQDTSQPPVRAQRVNIQ